MTSAEVVNRAFTRNIDEKHFQESDIVLAKLRYVDAYADGLTESDAYVKDVIAYGVAVDCWERVASEITDRGMVQATLQGGFALQQERSQELKQEYRDKLNALIKLMCDSNGKDIPDMSRVLVSTANVNVL
jgi:protein-tyrosine-phosphatase